MVVTNTLPSKVNIGLAPLPNNLNEIDCLNYKKIKNLPLEKLKELIRPSGYNNQKANYILNFIEFFEKLNGKIPTREELLAIKGIGFETADSILLYAYNQPELKVDAYTKRLLVHNKLLDEKAKYNDIKYIFALYKPDLKVERSILFRGLNIPQENMFG